MVMLNKGLKFESGECLCIEVLLATILICMGVSVPEVSYIALAYCVICVATRNDVTEIFIWLFFLLSFSEIFKPHVNATSFFTYLELIAVFKILWICHSAFSRKFLGTLIVWAFYLLVGSNLDINSAIKLMLLPMIVYFFVTEISYNGFKRVYVFYFAGVLLSSAVGYFKSYIPNMSQYVVMKDVNIGYNSDGFISVDRFSALWGDPNYYSVHLILCLSIAVVLFAHKDVNTNLFIVLYGLGTVLGGMTGSKSFLLAYSFVSICLFILLLINQQWKYALLILVFLTGGFFLIISGKINIFSTVFKRLSTVSSVADATTGRTELWIRYMKTIIDNPIKLLFGNGIGRGFTYTAPHNTVIDFMDVFGMIGTGIFLIMIRTALKASNIASKTKNYLPLIAITILYIFLSMINSIDFAFELALAFGGLYISKNIKQSYIDSLY